MEQYLKNSSEVDYVHALLNCVLKVKLQYHNHFKIHHDSIVADSEFNNLPVESMDTLQKTYGIQIIPHQLYSSIEESEKFFGWWGPYAVKARPASVQYEVNVPVEPAMISPRLNANGGNPTPPTLNL